MVSSPRQEAPGRPPEETKARARSLVVIAILLGLQVADGIDQQALSFTAPFVRRELDIGVPALGTAFSAGYIGTALGAVLFGTLADRVGRKLALCLAAVGYSVGSLSTILVHGGGELIAVRLLTGLALGGLFPVVATLILETVARHLRATAVTLVSVGTAVGVTLCGPLTAVMEPHFGWRSIFVVGGAIPAVFSVLAMLLIPGRAAAAATGRVPRVSAGNPLDSVLSLFGEGQWRTTLVLWAAFITSAVPMFFSVSWLPSLAHAAGLPPAVSAIGPALFTICGLLLAVVVARVIDRRGLRALVLTTALGAPAMVLLGQSFGGDTRFLVACGVAGAVSVSSVNLLGAVAGMLYGQDLRARGVGWAIAVMRLGAALAPGVGGLLIARGLPVGMIFAGLAVFPLLSALAIAALRENGGAQGRPPAT